MNNKKKPMLVNFVSWGSLILGVLLLIAAFLNLLAQLVNYNDIIDYLPIPQLLLSVIIIVSSIYLLRQLQFARILLESCLWAYLLFTVIFIVSWNKEILKYEILAMLQLWIPIALLIWGLRTKKVLMYVNST